MKRYILTTKYKIYDTYSIFNSESLHKKENKLYRFANCLGKIKSESDNVFDFIETDGNWGVGIDDIFFTVREIYNMFKGDYKNNLKVFCNDYGSGNEKEVKYIYHKDQKGNWIKVWEKEKNND